MSPMRKPSAVDSIRKAAAASASEKRVSEMTDAEVQSLAAPRRPRAPKPVRFTLDLDRDRHQFLKRYADEIEADGASQVMRALLDELRDDADLAARVRARVWQTGR